MDIKLKICGMKLNTLEVANLLPNYMGFIFWEPSSRYFDKEIPEIPKNIKKVGVFVDASISDILIIAKDYKLDVIQLHGSESPEYCKTLLRAELYSLKDVKNPIKQLQGNKLEIIKVFSIKDNFDFSVLNDYEEVCDYFLFDTKGKLPGGNGYAFDWKLLNDYPSTKPYFLSGGISLNDTEKIKTFLSQPEAKYCHALDVNSGFEIEAGLKNIEKLKEFISVLSIK